MLRAFSMLVADVSNAALYHTLILAALLLLRPVTVRLLTPQQRVVLWGVGLIPGPLLRLTWLKLLPVTFRDLIIPRTAEWMDLPIPAYLPEYQGAGEYLAVLPGGGTVSLELTDAALGVFGAVWLAGMYLLLRYMAQKGRELLSPALKGRLLCGENSPLLEVVPAGWREQVVVCTAEGFPTSFVESVGLIKGYKVGYVICLQQELSPERQRLVLTHEMGHIMLGHCIIKGLLTVMLLINWWNPVVWMTFRAVCRDLELACDQRTLQGLSPEERQEYLRTLVEMGSGRRMWEAPLCFGESDTAARVKAALAWKKWAMPRYAASCLLAVFLCLFFLGGPVVRDLPGEMEASWQEALHDYAAQEPCLQAWEARSWWGEEAWLLVQEEDGSWCRRTFRYERTGMGHGWYCKRGSTVEDPDLEGWDRVK